MAVRAELRRPFFPRRRRRPRLWPARRWPRWSSLMVRASSAIRVLSNCVGDDWFSGLGRFTVRPPRNRIRGLTAWLSPFNELGPRLGAFPVFKVSGAYVGQKSQLPDRGNGFAGRQRNRTVQIGLFHRILLLDE